MGFLNVAALIPQPLAMYRTGIVEGVAWQMYAIAMIV